MDWTTWTQGSRVLACCAVVEYRIPYQIIKRGKRVGRRKRKDNDEKSVKNKNN
jgi:hypothetical protein